MDYFYSHIWDVSVYERQNVGSKLLHDAFKKKLKMENIVPYHYDHNK